MPITAATLTRTAATAALVAALAACTPAGADVAPTASPKSGAEPSSTPAAVQSPPGVAPSVGSSSATVRSTAGIDSSRTHYCGAITGYDSKHGKLTFRAYASYVWGGETFTVRPESATFTVQGDGSTRVNDQTNETSRLVNGTLEERYRYARRHGSGSDRALLEMSQGRLVTIDVNTAYRTKTADGCPAGR